MTKTKTPPADTDAAPDVGEQPEPPLGWHEGRPVWQSGIEIPGAGGGFHDALAVLPETWEDHSVIDVVIRCKVDHHGFEDTKLKPGDPPLPDNAYRRVHVLKPLVAAVDNAGICAALIAEAEERVEELREERQRRVDEAKERAAEDKRRAKAAAKNGAAVQVDGQGSLDELTDEERKIAETFGGK